MEAAKNDIPQTAPKKNLPGLPLLIPFLAALSALSGYLLSRASLAGRTGINLFYAEYRFLKTWWQGAAVVFVVLILFVVLQGWINRKWRGPRAVAIHLVCAVLAIAGLYFTYRDFREVLSHRLLGERFHLGAYLFWVGWIVISVFYAAHNRRTPLQPGI